MIEGEKAIEVWKRLLRHVFENGRDFTDQNGRQCRQVINMVSVVKKPSVDAEEPIQILNSFQTWKYPTLQEIANVILSRKRSLDYSYSYGPRIFNYRDTLDQVNDFVIPMLKSFPDTRRAGMTLWDPQTDSQMYATQVPGLVYVDFKLHQDKKLYITAVIRSNDLFFGWPANVYQLWVLLDYVCKKLECEPGHLSLFSVSAHIFDSQFEQIKKILGEK